MTTKKIYEKVSLVMPLEQRRFFNYLEDSVNELGTMFSGDTAELVFEEQREMPDDLNDEMNVLPDYHNAIVDNILFLAGAGEEYKGEFIRKAQAAYLEYWRKNAKGRRVRRARW